MPPNHVREYVQRLQVDKNVKTFNIGDEFLVHAFKGHLTAAICTLLKLKSQDDPVAHIPTLQWLEKTAEMIVAQTFFPVPYSYRSCLQPAQGFPTYSISLCRLEECNSLGRWPSYHTALEVVASHTGRHWMQELCSGSCPFVANVTSRFPRHIAYIVTHNRTVNMDGRPGHGKPMDQMMEHYNL